MKRTSIMLPADVRAKAKSYAKERGVTLGELVREALVEKIAEGVRHGRDPLFRRFPFPVNVAPTPDGAANHDAYLYGES